MRRARRPQKLPSTENQLQYSCVQLLKVCAAEGVWWHHSPNECIRDVSIFHQAKMGCLFGFWDLVVFRPLKIFDAHDSAYDRKIDEAHWFELKVKDGRLTENEEQFRAMLYERGAKHKVCRDLETFKLQCETWELFR